MKHEKFGPIVHTTCCKNADAHLNGVSASFRKRLSKRDISSPKIVLYEWSSLHHRPDCQKCITFGMLIFVL